MGREKVFAIQLYRDDLCEVYCGCWHVASSEGDPYRERLHAAGFGCYRDEDGTIRRAFFFGDEIDEQLEAAQRVTECFTEWDEVRAGAA